MNIAVLHLSDIHLTTQDNPVLSRVTQICQAIGNMTQSADAIFALVTGDISDNGKKAEYEKADELFQQLFSGLSRYSNQEIRLLLMPGNHDCLHIINKGNVRKATVDAIKAGTIKPDQDDVIKQCCAAQTNYNAFAKRNMPVGHMIFNDRLLKIITFEIDGYNILFHLYNSSWMSQKVENPSSLRFPVEKYLKIIPSSTSDLVIGALHHSLSWFENDTRRKLTAHLASKSHLIFTGHEWVCEIFTLTLISIFFHNNIRE